jgi:hypothetical protein
VLIPLDAEVERAPTELFVVERPVEAEVESDAVLLAFAVIPDDAEVESAVALLFVVDSPVDSEPTPL